MATPFVGIVIGGRSNLSRNKNELSELYVYCKDKESFDRLSRLHAIENEEAAGRKKLKWNERF